MNLAFYYLNNNSQTSPHRPKKVFNNANCHYKKTIIDKNILSLSTLVQFDQQPKPISRMIKTNNLCKNSYLCLRRDRYKNPQDSNKILQLFTLVRRLKRGSCKAAHIHQLPASAEHGEATTSSCWSRISHHFYKPVSSHLDSCPGRANPDHHLHWMIQFPTGAEYSSLLDSYTVTRFSASETSPNPSQILQATSSALNSN